MISKATTMAKLTSMTTKFHGVLLISALGTV